jgi:hypothetical protein
MTTPPSLPEIAGEIPLEPYYALLINPFYPKDPAASFGKHVLTPSLALTSFAATTPDLGESSTGTRIFWTALHPSIRSLNLSASRST